MGSRAVLFRFLLSHISPRLTFGSSVVCASFALASRGNRKTRLFDRGLWSNIVRIEDGRQLWHVHDTVQDLGNVQFERLVAILERLLFFFQGTDLGQELVARR